MLKNPIFSNRAARNGKMHRSDVAAPAQTRSTPSSWTTAATAARFARAQVVNSARNAAAIRPFKVDEFGTGPGCPSAAHIAAANRMIQELQNRLLGIVDRLGGASMNV